MLVIKHAFSPPVSPILFFLHLLPISISVLLISFFYFRLFLFSLSLFLLLFVYISLKLLDSLIPLILRPSSSPRSFSSFSLPFYHYFTLSHFIPIFSLQLSIPLPFLSPFLTSSASITVSAYLSLQLAHALPSTFSHFRFLPPSLSSYTSDLPSFSSCISTSFSCFISPSFSPFSISSLLLYFT